MARWGHESTSLCLLNRQQTCNLWHKAQTVKNRCEHQCERFFSLHLHHMVFFCLSSSSSLASFSRALTQSISSFSLHKYQLAGWKDTLLPNQRNNQPTDDLPVVGGQVTSSGDLFWAPRRREMLAVNDEPSLVNRRRRRCGVVYAHSEWKEKKKC